MENKTLMGIIGIIILIVVGISIISASTSSMTKGADSISQANNCSSFVDADGHTLTYNLSSGGCFNSSFGAAYNASLFTAQTYTLPLSSLFATGGVVMLVVMAGLLIFFVRKAIKK